MVYTANQLITGAYYAAGIVSREFETLSGGQVADGLQWLNDIISEKRVDDGMIPYETQYNFTAQIGVEKYFIPNLIQIDTLVFYLDQVRYAMNYTKRNQYLGSPRVENINSLPFEWYFERQFGGGTLYIYFKPDREYPFEVHGSFNLNNVQLGEDLAAGVTTANLGIPKFYGTGLLNAGQLVVNGVDLMGTYPDIFSLVSYINDGTIPGVTANTVGTNFVLSASNPPIQITLQTTGYPPDGTDFIGSALVATTAALPGSSYFPPSPGLPAELSGIGMLTVDGHPCDLGDVVLVKNQADPIQNGVYFVDQAFPNWSLTGGFNSSMAQNYTGGELVTVTSGTVNAGLTFIQTSEDVTIGTDPIVFANFNALSFSIFSTIQKPKFLSFNAGGFDQFYLTYLRYALADRICSEYNYDTPMNVMRQLSKYEAWIRSKSRTIDLQMTKVSTLQKRGSFNYAFVNLGKGWVKPG